MKKFGVAISGLDEVVDTFAQDVCSATNVPEKYLFGISYKEAESLDCYYAMVSGERRRFAERFAERLARAERRGARYHKRRLDWTSNARRKRRREELANRIKINERTP